MKIVSVQSLLHAAILVIVSTAAGRAEEKGTVPVSQQELQAKISYCKTCHGVSGQGFRGSYPMPRLAGSSPTILKISCGPLLSGGGPTQSCLTWPTS